MKTQFLILPFILSCFALTGCQTAPTMTKEAQQGIKPDQAYEMLVQGNARFVSGKTLHRDLHKQVKETAEGQYPFASVVSCIDSRTSTELIFDQGIGDVFNARVAGNIVNPDILGSLEYAAKVANSKVIAVIGHTHCGAIKGACDHVDKFENLPKLLARIEPALDATRSEKGEDRSSKNHHFVDRVAETNVRKTIENIRKGSKDLREMEAKGDITIVGGIYDVETGVVRFL